MLLEEKNMLWRLAAASYGAALPLVFVGRSLMFGLIIIGLLAGLLATKGDSLRASVKQLTNNTTVLVVIIMLVAWLASAALGTNPAHALDKWLQVLLVGVCAGGIFISLREMPGVYVELMLKALAIAAAAMMALAMTDALLDYQRLSDALHGDNALSNYRLNFFSGALAVLLPFVWARILIKSGQHEPFAQRIVVPASVLSIAVLVACGGRAGWVGLAVAGPLFIWLGTRHHGLVLHARHWGLGLLAIGLGLLVYTYSHGWDFVAARINPALEAGVGRGIASGRLEIYAQVAGFIQQFGLKEWLLGVGPMGYRYLPGAADLHPHNWVLQLLLETGLIGFTAFVTLMGMLVWRFYGYARGNLYGVAALASLVAFLVVALASTSIFNAWWMTYLTVAVLIGWRVGWAGAGLPAKKKGRTVPKAALVQPGYTIK